jgi:hypothetical protein
MYPRSSPKEIVFAVGTFLVFVGLVGLVALGQAKLGTTTEGTLQILFSTSLIVGTITHLAGFISLSGRWRRPAAQTGNPGGFPWFSVAAVVLWIIILPFALLRAYAYVHRH